MTILLTIIVLSLFTSCGSKNDEPAAPALAEVGTISTPKVSVYSDGTSLVSFTFTTEGDTTGHTAVAAFKTGADAPADCKTADVLLTSPRSGFIITSFKAGQTFGMRVCMVNDSGQESAGKTAKIVVAQ